MEIEAIDGRLDATGKRFAVVAARFNHRLVDLLGHRLGGTASSNQASDLITKIQKVFR